MELLFSVTRKDFVVEEFCTGGPGGQNQNRKKNGIRITHPESGAVGEGRVHKSQWQNKQEALERLVTHPKWKLWHAKKVAEMMTGRTVESRVDEMMGPENLKVEVKDENDRWVEEGK